MKGIIAEHERAPESLELQVQQYLQEHPYVETIAGRPAIEVYDRDGEFLGAVPLPKAITSHAKIPFRQETKSETLYRTVKTDRAYANIPWAHNALVKMASEYDALENVGLGDLYAFFRKQSHRLAVLETGDDLIQLLGNKLDGRIKFYQRHYEQDRGGHDIGHMHPYEDARGNVTQVLTLNAISYVSHPGSILAHELSHIIDHKDAHSGYYSGNDLFRAALETDLAFMKSKPEELNKFIATTILGMSSASKSLEEATGSVEKEFYATLFEMWIDKPEEMAKTFPTVQQYLERYVVPDLRLRQTNDLEGSPLSTALQQKEVKDLPREHGQPKPSDFLHDLSKMKFDLDQKPGDQTQYFMKNFRALLDDLDYLIAEHLPRPDKNARSRQQAGLQSLEAPLLDNMLHIAGTDKVPAPYRREMTFSRTM